jgi:hypothetical protein
VTYGLEAGQPAVGNEYVAVFLACLVTPSVPPSPDDAKNVSPLAIPFWNTASNFAVWFAAAPAERLLGDAEAHREDGPGRIRIDLVADRLEQVREPLDAFRLRGRHADQNDVRERRDRVRPLDVEVRLTRPAFGAGRPGLAVADVREVRLAVWIETAVKFGLDRFGKKVSWNFCRSAAPVGVPYESTSTIVWPWPRSPAPVAGSPSPLTP